MYLIHIQWILILEVCNLPIPYNTNKQYGLVLLKVRISKKNARKNERKKLSNMGKAKTIKLFWPKKISSQLMKFAFFTYEMVELRLNFRNQSVSKSEE